MGDLKPRERLLETAGRLFYEEGIRAVGVDRLVSESGITRATFYRHFRSKDDLVVAYIRSRDDALRAEYAAVRSQAADARVLFHAVMVGVTMTICGAGFRGCPFINAAAEFPDATSSVRRAIADHRAWFADTVHDLLVTIGHPDPDSAATRAVVLRDGAMVAGYLGDHDAIGRELLSAAEELVGAIPDRQRGS